MSKCRQVKTSLAITTNELLMENEDLLALQPKDEGIRVGWSGVWSAWEWVGQCSTPGKTL